MKRHWRLWLGLGLLLLSGASLLHPAVYWPLVGWARGEAFYRGRPSSYWSQQMQYWAREDPDPVRRRPGLVGEFLDWLTAPVPGSFEWVNDPAAVGVLIDLLPDPAPIGTWQGELRTVGHQAAHYLSQQQPAAWEGVPALIAGLRAPDRATRRVSVHAVGSMLFNNSGASHPNYSLGVSALQSAEADEDSLVEVFARHYLRQLDQSAARRAERLAREGR